MLPFADMVGAANRVPEPDGPDERYETLILQMPRIAAAVEAFADPTLRERAYYELIGILNPTPDDPEPVDVIAVPQWGDAPASAAEIGRLATWILDDAPSEWRDSIKPGESTVDAAIRFLTEGDKAHAALILVRRELVEQGGFSAEQAEGDLIPLIRELAADKPVAPEIEQLALYLRAARPDESAVDVARSLLETLPTDQGLRREPGQVDDREQVKP